MAETHAGGPRKRLLLGVPPDTPPVDVMLSGQVSWLAGHRLHPAFPKPLLQ